ncbi:MAG: UdgX family uracil-DNA binding protein [Sphingopyxis sp.]
MAHAPGAQRGARSIINQHLADGHDFDEWRGAARALLARGIEPDGIIWSANGCGGGDLFAQPPPPAAADGGGAAQVRVQVPRNFLPLARSAILHTHPQRHALLYRLLWRLQAQPALLANAADGDVRQLARLNQQVGRDIHKMRAFVRFRRVDGPAERPMHGPMNGTGQPCDDADARANSGPDAGPDAGHYVAWFEPHYAILRANAAFFCNRFARMRWSILTPIGSLHWDGATLMEGPPARAADAPQEDGAEDLWRDYYAAIFNPARLKINAMVREMPRHYWKNLPEARLIPTLIAGAQQREAAMVAIGQSAFPAEQPTTLDALASAIATCRACAIGCNGTRAVPGRGNPSARLAIIGEQPGDQEERTGRPFIGPAGQLLDQHLRAAGIDRSAAWMTNAVKHFKFSKTAQRRLHQTPTAAQVDHCRWWLDSELAIIQPRIILALGANAARGLLGRTVSVQRERGRFMPYGADAVLLITVHPSYLLRIAPAHRAEQEAQFAADLQLISRALHHAPSSAAPLHTA